MSSLSVNKFMAYLFPKIVHSDTFLCYEKQHNSILKYNHLIKVFIIYV